MYHIFKFLSRDLHRVKPEIFEGSPESWMDIEKSIAAAFAFEGNCEEREENWIRKLSEGCFGFKAEVRYDDREWFNAAVKVISDHSGDDKYERKEGFSDSHWFDFQNALINHRHYVKNELFPKYEIIT